MLLQIGERERDVDCGSIPDHSFMHLPEFTTIVQLFILHSKDIPHTSTNDLNCSKREK